MWAAKPKTDYIEEPPHLRAAHSRLVCGPKAPIGAWLLVAIRLYDGAPSTWRISSAGGQTSYYSYDWQCID